MKRYCSIAYQFEEYFRILKEHCVNLKGSVTIQWGLLHFGACSLDISTTV